MTCFPYNYACLFIERIFVFIYEMQVLKSRKVRARPIVFAPVSSVIGSAIFHRDILEVASDRTAGLLTQQMGGHYKIYFRRFYWFFGGVRRRNEWP